MPEDGYIINLQARPCMVAGEVRLGAIVSFVCAAGRYLLTRFFQDNLKYVKPGQAIEAAIDLYPGQIFTGKLQAIWQGSGAGQMLPSGTLPNFQYRPTELTQGQFAVAIKLDDPDQSKFLIGTQGRARRPTFPFRPPRQRGCLQRFSNADRTSLLPSEPYWRPSAIWKRQSWPCCLACRSRCLPVDAGCPGESEDPRNRDDGRHHAPRMRLRERFAQRRVAIG